MHATGEGVGLRMTERDAREAEEQATEAPADDGPGEGGRGTSAWVREPVGLAVIFLFVAVVMIVDVLADVREGAAAGHLGVELGVALLALGGLAVMWRRLALARRSARELQVALDGTRADLARWRSEAQGFLRGLGAAIDGQFDRWGPS